MWDDMKYGAIGHPWDVQSPGFTTPQEKGCDHEKVSRNHISINIPVHGELVVTQESGGDTVHDKVTANSPGTPLFCLDSFFQTHIELYFF